MALGIGVSMFRQQQGPQGLQIGCPSGVGYAIFLDPTPPALVREFPTPPALVREFLEPDFRDERSDGCWLFFKYRSKSKQIRRGKQEEKDLMYLLVDLNYRQDHDGS
ncbi:hypothetical protein V6N13_141094 [Hibiscus sabdariffa]|uniref:Uncharacterized protein n=1 Tax=Hibiscus sabdariffa TaxID=183260 RepID=A0ABR2Q0X7_9ROSI